MAQIREEQYNSVLDHIQLEIASKVENHNGVRVIRFEDIIELAKLVPYGGYLAATGKKIKPEIPIIVKQLFSDFWSTFPATSKFKYKGKEFQGERTLRANKEKCLQLYYDMLLKMTQNPSWENAGYIVNKALRVNIETIKIESYKTGQNRMQYLSNIETYIRQRKYEPWIGEEMPEEVQSKKSVVDTMDI